MPFVLDASVSLSWCLPDELSDQSARLLRMLEEDAAVVPRLWLTEHANGLLVAERRGRLTPVAAARANEILLALPITQANLSLGEVLGAVLELARGQRLSAYDATYLALALRDGFALATLDTRLRAAARNVGVRLVE